MVIFSKLLTSKYAASWAKQSLSNSFMCKSFNLPVSLNFKFSYDV